MKNPHSLITIYFRFSFFRQTFWGIASLCIICLPAVILFHGEHLSSKPVGWGSDYQVTPAAILTKNLSVASQGNLIIAVYDGIENKKKGIYASLSFNGGESYLQPIQIAGMNSELDGNPTAAISGKGVITIAWHDFIEKESTNRIFFSVSTNMGAAWSPPKQADIGLEAEMLPKIFYDNRGELHLFYHGFRREVINLYHAYSPDGIRFKTTGAILKLEREMRGAFFPAIYFSGSDIYIVWQSKGEKFTDDLYFTSSTNYGGSWSSNMRITFGPSSSASPSVVLYKNTLYLVYQNNEEKVWTIKLLRGLGNGSVWDKKAETVSTGSSDCYSPKIVFSNDNLVIVWHDAREKEPRIFARKYSLDTEKLSPEEKLSLRNLPAKNPYALTVGNKIMILWEEGNTILEKNSDVYAAPPAVVSVTHPEGRWSRANIAQLEWNIPDDDSGIVGYATDVNDWPDFEPAVQTMPNPNITRMKTKELSDGAHYFHIRSIDGTGNWSRTVHYKIRVSATPLATPVVVSPTHPEPNKPGTTDSPVFRWPVENTERLKGFYYSFSKDPAGMPDKFITDFELKFDQLDEGIYFFKIGAVDKTDQVSEIAMFPVVIGSARFTKDDAKKWALEGSGKKAEGGRVAGMPFVEITFPFAEGSVYGKNYFDAVLSPRNIPRDSLIGYSVYVERGTHTPGDKVNMRGNRLSVKGLNDGDYYVGVKGRYFVFENGMKNEYWTQPVIKKISIKLSAGTSPLDYYSALMYDKVSKKTAASVITLFSLTMAIGVLGFGAKIYFYARLFQFRIRNLL